MLNCLIVDDEPLARQQIEAYVSRVPFLKLVGAVRKPALAQAILETEMVDLIFLDIQMPQMTGIEFLKSREIFQQVIFITAFPEFALEGYELEVTDYLVKPVTFERFLRACEKAQAKVSGSGAVRVFKEHPDFIYVKCDQSLEKIRVGEILYIEAMLNYIHIVLPNRKYTVYSGLKAIESRLPGGLFLRSHKSYLVAIAHIDAVEQQQIRIGNHYIPIGRSHKTAVRQVFDRSNL